MPNDKAAWEGTLLVVCFEVEAAEIEKKERREYKKNKIK